MKKFLLSSVIACCLLLANHASANSIIVKGRVTDSSGNAVAGKTVRIYNADSTLSACVVTHSVVTNPNGVYSDTVACSGSIGSIVVVVEDCRGSRIIHNVSVNNGSNIAESNFVVCVTAPPPPPSPSCKAQFRDSVMPGGVVRFTSQSSAAAPGDSIISRKWTFGDTSTLTGNRVDPLHTYAKPGNYNACLFIRTKNGCKSSVCTTIAIKDTTATTPPAPACKANFTATIKDSVVFVKSGTSTVPAGDTIVSRTWYFMDSTTAGGGFVLQGNITDTFRKYSRPGTYTIKLLIKTKKGCESDFTVAITIPKPVTSCSLQPFITVEKLSAHKYRFSSSQSQSAGDSIISRKWKFGDGTILEGNEISPAKEFKDTGVYNVCVVIKTKAGCEKDFCVQVQVRDSVAPPPSALSCKAAFSFSIQNLTVKFNSAASTGVDSGDAITNRTWIFGDSSQTGTNSVDPSHNYQKAGTYTVFLYIKTKKGCENKFSATITVGQTTNDCKLTAAFTAVRISPKKVQFNSAQSISLTSDSIIQRRWKFGDGTTLEGNIVNPVKEFPFQGIYNTCLQIRTVKGCEAEVCKPVAVQDTTPVPEAPADMVRIISLNPNPVVTRMLATIQSRNNNVEVEIAILDIYGLAKWSVKKLLSQGNNVIEIPVANLYRGPYFLKVTSKGSRDSRVFYKL